MPVCKWFKYWSEQLSKTMGGDYVAQFHDTFCNCGNNQYREQSDMFRQKGESGLEYFRRVGRDKIKKD